MAKVAFTFHVKKAGRKLDVERFNDAQFKFGYLHAERLSVFVMSKDEEDLTRRRGGAKESNPSDSFLLLRASAPSRETCLLELLEIDALIGLGYLHAGR